MMYICKKPRHKYSLFASLLICFLTASGSGMLSNLARTYVRTYVRTHVSWPCMHRLNMRLLFYCMISIY